MVFNASILSHCGLGECSLDDEMIKITVVAQWINGYCQLVLWVPAIEKLSEHIERELRI